MRSLFFIFYFIYFNTLRHGFPAGPSVASDPNQSRVFLALDGRHQLSGRRLVGEDDDDTGQRAQLVHDAVVVGCVELRRRRVVDADLQAETDAVVGRVLGQRLVAFHAVLGGAVHQRAISPVERAAQRKQKEDI